MGQSLSFFDQERKKWYFIDSKVERLSSGMKDKNASNRKICSLAVNGQSFLVIDGYL